MKDLKRKIHYWCSDTMQTKSLERASFVPFWIQGSHSTRILSAASWDGRTVYRGRKPYMMTTDTEPMWQEFLPEMEKAEEACTAEWHRRRRSLPVKVLNQRGGGKIRDVINGIRYVLLKQKEMKIRIVNISIGTLPHKKDPEDELFLFWVERLWDAGLVVVTAAGNKGPKEGSVTIPGNSRKVITVGADEELGKKYSGCGPTGDCIKKPDLAVPGNRIYSCNYLYPVRSPYAYIPKTGTSMATPVVSGAAALVLQKYPDMCNLELKYRLWNSCEKGRYYDQRQGHGNLHVEKFLECQEKILDTNENLLYDSTGDK